MLLFGYPIEIYIASFIAVLIKLQTGTKLSWFGAITTTLVALFAGVILYQPILIIFGLPQAYSTIVAIIVALSTENLCKVFLELSADREWIKNILRFWVEKKIDKKDTDS